MQNNLISCLTICTSHLFTIKLPFAFQFDQALCQKLELYNSLRQNNSISPMQVIQVSQGTFSKLKQDIIKETQNQQFKMPRVIKDENYISTLFKAKIEK